MLELGFKLTLGYWLGSVLGSLLLGYIYGGPDIRSVGSGNAGATNAMRFYGKTAALWILLIDGGKGVVAAAVLPGLDIPGIGIDPDVDRTVLTYAVALAAIIGHVVPIWFDFRGGKGGATAAGLLIYFAPVAALPVIGLWALIIYLTRYVGLATILACFGAAAVFGIGQQFESLDVVFVGVADRERSELIAFACIVAVLVLYTHRDNVRRMLNGTESKIGQAPNSE